MDREFEGAVVFAELCLGYRMRTLIVMFGSIVGRAFECPTLDLELIF